MTIAAPRLALLVLAFGLLLAPPLAADGIQTGTLSGRVVDTESLPLPGVEVELRGPQTRRRAETDENGRFRFTQLEIGAYEVKASLLGLEALAQDARVYIDKTTDLKLQLGAAGAETATPQPAPSPGELPAEREQIQVFALAPLIDRFETSVRTSVDREFLEGLPVEPFYQSVALLLPGVVGGNDGNPNVSGALRSGNLSLIDGVDTTDPTTGLFGLNLAFDGIAEVAVTTAAPDVDFGRVSGAVINVVTRSGDSSFRGRARTFSQIPSLGGDVEKQSNPELNLQADAANATPNELDTTFSLSLGGPVLADRIWAFGSFEQGQDSFLRNTLAGTWNEDTRLEGFLSKIEARSQGHSLVFQLSSDQADFATYSGFDREPGENRASQAPALLGAQFLLAFPGDPFAVEQRRQAGDFAKLDWNGVLLRDFVASARIVEQDRQIDRDARNFRTPDSQPHLVELPARPGALDTELVLFNAPFTLGSEARSRRQINVGSELFLRRGQVDHELRFGLDLQVTESTAAFRVPGRAGTDKFTGRPVSGQVFLDTGGFDPVTGSFGPGILFNAWQNPEHGTEQDLNAAYVSETLSVGRWQFSLGLRWDEVTARSRDGALLVDTAELAPRLAAKVDALGDGSLLISAVYSRFVEPFPQGFFDDFVEPFFFSGYTQYLWTGLNGADCSGEDPANPGSRCWITDPAGSLVENTSPTQLAPPNPDLQRAKVSELVLGFERQLTSQTALRLTYIDREWDDLWDDVPLTNGTSTIENLEAATRSYRGVHLLVQKRFADRWQMLASYTFSESRGNLFDNNGRSSFADFRDFTQLNLINREGPAPYDSPHQLKIFANYRQPLGQADLVLGSIFRFETGPPIERQRSQELGILFETPRGSERLEDLTQLDLSALVEIPVLRRAELSFRLELINALNEQAQRGAETLVDTGRYGQPRTLADLQTPRRVRLALGLTF